MPPYCHRSWISYNIFPHSVIGASPLLISGSFLNATVRFGPTFFPSEREGFLIFCHFRLSGVTSRTASMGGMKKSILPLVDPTTQPQPFPTLLTFVLFKTVLEAYMDGEGAQALALVFVQTGTLRSRGWWAWSTA